jgi:hypothetical protein
VWSFGFELPLRAGNPRYLLAGPAVGNRLGRRVDLRATREPDLPGFALDRQPHSEIAYKEFRKAQGPRRKFRFFTAVRQSKDPATFTVLFEDSAAMLGLVAAAAGVAAAYELGLAWADGVASIVIGAILAGAAILLARETNGLLIGEAASPAVVRGIREIIKDAPEILHINELRTMHLAPYEILVALSVDFADGISSQRVEDAVSKLERRIKESYPEVRRLFIEVQAKHDGMARRTP